MLQDTSYSSRLAGTQATAPLVNGYIQSQAEAFNIPASKIALVGFSQGTMMSLYVGTHYPEKLAGVLGYSGALIWPQDIDSERLQEVPIHLIHGEADNVVPVEAYHDAKSRLEKANYKISGHTTPGLMHGIDEPGIESGREFLKKILR